MLTVLLYLSFFGLLFFFFVSVSFRLDFLSSAIMYAMIFWFLVVPITVVYIEEKNYEMKKAKSSQNKAKS
ncbi:hypothetical protein EWI07_07855 [Sporolactobacillus sp. THM7-4]|nr:hypothetical protein EWI07_07855 [Sporolactobacillus sp. THM7-4]